MKRDPALQDLSRDHFFALGLAKRLLAVGSRDADDQAVHALASELNEAWERDLHWHLREEEESLLPALARHVEPCSIPEVRQLLDDHFWLRNAIRTLEGLVQSRALDADHLASIGKRLHDHVRLEERSVFPILEQTLTTPELAELAEASTAFRMKWRSQEVIGSNRQHG